MNDPEAAQSALEKAQSALQRGDSITADRLARKAKRMFSEQNSAGRSAADRIINQVEQSTAPKSANRASAASSAASPNQDNLRQRKPTQGDNGDVSQPDTTADFNPEQEAKCRVILRSKCYYKTLSVEKGCSADEIKKSYRKLALQFHPDKAKCPSAEAAFKELSKAYQCLSDDQARRHYDTYGTEDDAPQQQQYRQHYESHFMTPEELFESFFGVHFARGPYTQHRVYRTRTQAQHHNPPTGDQRRSFGLLQFFPLIVLLFITVISSLFNSPSAPPFSLSRTSEYSVSRATPDYQLPYFVKPTFPRTYASDRIRDLEVHIELSHFSSECNREQSRLLQQLSALKFYGTAEQYRKKSEELRQKEESSVSCRNVKKLKAKYPRQAHQFYRNSQSVWF